MTSSQKSNPDERTLRLVEEALSLRQADDQDGALETLVRAQVLAPDYAPIHLLIGLIYQEKGRWEEAVARLRRVIELDPNHADAIQNLGLLLLKQQRSQEGVELLRRHAVLRPADPVTLKTLGNELLRLKRQDEAIELFEGAWQSSHRPEIGLAFGRYLVRLRMHDQAERIFAEVARDAPTPQVLLELASAIMLQGRPAQAIEVLTKAIDLQPDFAPAWRGLSACYLGTRQFSKALEAAGHLLSLDGEDCRNWLVKANALSALERFSEVLEATRTGTIDVQIMFRGRGDPLRSPRAGARHCPYESLSDAL